MSPEFLKKWEHIIDDVDKQKIPVEFIKKLVIKMRNKRQQTVNVKKFLDQGLDPEQIEAAVSKKLAEMDASLGLQDPRDVARRMRGESTVNTPATQSGLDDTTLANNLRTQATKMLNEAKGLMAEADRLNKEADALLPKKAKKTKAKVDA